MRCSSEPALVAARALGLAAEGFLAVALVLGRGAGAAGIRADFDAGGWMPPAGAHKR